MALWADDMLVSVLLDTWQLWLCGESQHPVTEVCKRRGLERGVGWALTHLILVGRADCVEMHLPCVHTVSSDMHACMSSVCVCFTVEKKI